MKLHSVIGMHTDHSFYGTPIETSRVETWISEDIEWTPEMIDELKRNATERLHSMAKNMPVRYWQEPKS